MDLAAAVECVIPAGEVSFVPICNPPQCCYPEIPTNRDETTYFITSKLGVATCKGLIVFKTMVRVSSTARRRKVDVDYWCDGIESRDEYWGNPTTTVAVRNVSPQPQRLCRGEYFAQMVILDCQRYGASSEEATLSIFEEDDAATKNRSARQALEQMADASSLALRNKISFRVGNTRSGSCQRCFLPPSTFGIIMEGEQVNNLRQKDYGSVLRNVMKNVPPPFVLNGIVDNDYSGPVIVASVRDRRQRELALQDVIVYDNTPYVTLILNGLFTKTLTINSCSMITVTARTFQYFTGKFTSAVTQRVKRIFVDTREDIQHLHATAGSKRLEKTFGVITKKYQAYRRNGSQAEAERPRVGGELPQVYSSHGKEVQLHSNVHQECKRRPEKFKKGHV